MTEPEKEPKIIVDGDWKSQVEAEKAELQKKQDEEQHEEVAAQDDAGGESYPLPPASFPFLVSTLATQAMAAMGQLSDPSQGEPEIQRDVAKHLIDTLAVLEEKTKGNLSQDESGMLTGVLHELRMAYVAGSQSGPATTS